MATTVARLERCGRVQGCIKASAGPGAVPNAGPLQTYNHSINCGPPNCGPWRCSTLEPPKCGTRRVRSVASRRWAAKACRYTDGLRLRHCRRVRSRSRARRYLVGRSQPGQKSFQHMCIMFLLGANFDDHWTMSP